MSKQDQLIQSIETELELSARLLLESHCRLLLIKAAIQYSLLNDVK